MEVWKDIKGFEGRYKISSYGRVKSLFKKRNSDIYKKFIMKNRIGGTGYLTVGLRLNCKTKNFNIHRLVAEHFIDNPLNKSQVNHKDGNKKNANVENLEWVTPSENGIHAYKNNLSKAWNNGLRGSETGKYRSVFQVWEDGKYKKWDCISDAVRENGFDSGCITRCCNKENSNHKGFIWIYEDDFSEKEINTRLKMLPDKIKRISKDGKIKYYNSPIDAAKDGYNRTGIIGCCKGYYKSSKGYKWEYIKHLDYLEEISKGTAMASSDDAAVKQEINY